MNFRTNKFQVFWNIRNFFAKSLKKSDSKFEIWDIFGFFFQNTTTTEAFFFEKKLSQILLKIGSDVVQRK